MFLSLYDILHFLCNWLSCISFRLLSYLGIWGDNQSKITQIEPRDARRPKEAHGHDFLVIVARRIVEKSYRIWDAIEIDGQRTGAPRFANIANLRQNRRDSAHDSERRDVNGALLLQSTGTFSSCQ